MTLDKSYLTQVGYMDSNIATDDSDRAIRPNSNSDITSHLIVGVDKEYTTQNQTYFQVPQKSQPK